MRNKFVTSLAFIFVTVFYVHAFDQDTTKPHLNIGIRYSFYYNYKVVHHVTVLSIDFGKHNLYIGPQYSNIVKPIGDPIDKYEKNSYGLNFGYRYYSKELFQKIKFLGQYNFSIYQIKYDEYQLGPPSVINHEALVVENTVTIGVDYKILKKLHVFWGIGFGSEGGFFLILDQFIPSTYLGIEYRF